MHAGARVGNKRVLVVMITLLSSVVALPSPVTRLDIPLSHGVVLEEYSVARTIMDSSFVPHTDPKAAHRYLSLRFTAPTSVKQLTVRLRDQNFESQSTGTGQSNSGRFRTLPSERTWISWAALPPKTESFQLVVGVAAGPWRTQGVYQCKDGQAQYQSGFQFQPKLSMQKSLLNRPRMEIAVRLAPGMATQDCKVIALDAQGREIQSEANARVDDERLLFFYGVSKERVDRVMLATRDFTWTPLLRLRAPGAKASLPRSW